MKNKSILVGIVISLSIIDFLLFLDVLSIVMKYTGQGKQLLIENIMTVIIGFIIFGIVQITFHEFGHYLYGKYRNFIFCSFTIFQFSIKKRNNNIRFGFTHEFLKQGSCNMIPRKVEQIYNDLPFYSLCGPVSDFFLVLIGVLSFLYLTRRTQIMTLEIMLSCIFIVINQIAFILNLMPGEYGCYYSDGTKLLWFIRNSETDQENIHNLYISSQLFIGIRPKNISFMKFNEDKAKEGQKRNLLLDIHMYYHFLDKEDTNTALKQIEIIESSKENYFPIMGERLVYEVFYACCVLKKDIVKAEQIYSNISDSINNMCSLTSYRIRMAYELYVKNDIEKTYEIGKKVLVSKYEEDIEGMAVFELEQIKKMMKELGEVRIDDRKHEGGV
ncbi:MAG: hypothetical protein BWY74_01393 [Firmicutes bacterium ADurb.Bin419]|nr:MAG: hypothetical protein BWY74_01393 [Firmicutes bacterium ADurb.Bin419]